MEENFNPNDFEEFLRDQVRNHRMYPNDAVWRDINKKLHGDNKWPALTIAAFILLSATIAISVYFTPHPDIFAINSSHNELKNSTLSNSQHSIALNNVSPSASLFKEKISLPQSEKNQVTVSTIAAPPIYGASPAKVIGQTKPAAFVQKVDKEEIHAKNIKTDFLAKAEQQLIYASAAPVVTEGSPVDIKDSNATIPPTKATSRAVIKPLSENPKVAKDYNDKYAVDNFLKEHADDVNLHTASKIKSVKNRFSFQIYIAPSVSYRKLVEDKSILNEGTNPGPVGLNYVADVNKVVRHKPGNGLEVGVGIMYHLSNNFRIKSGFQFNVRQYSIEAFRSSSERASIALIENNRIDTVNTFAIYRNSNGYYPAELVNRYYQFAIPVGIEWEVIGNKRIQLNIAGSIQPTYLINHNAYLLSTNFKNYSENPNLVRSFNVNSNIETYISFKVGDFKWQVGPQLRYQPYSTFVPQYPIKEHLLDYGIKFGLSKTF